MQNPTRELKNRSSKPKTISLTQNGLDSPNLLPTIFNLENVGPLLGERNNLPVGANVQWFFKLFQT